MKPVDVQRILAVALNCHRAGRLPDAEAGYRQILDAHPRHADALHLLGVVAHQSGKADEAARTIQEAIRIRPNVADYHNNLGEVYRASSRWDDARAEYERALILNPQFFTAWNNLGIVLESLNQTDSARAAYENALRLQPNYFEALHNLGVLQARTGRPEEALRMLEAARQLAPLSAQVHCSIGDALEKLGRIEEAIAAFERAIELDPALAIAQYNRANALQTVERYEEAAKGYLAAIRKAPAFADAYNNYGHVLIRLKRHKEALAAIRQALQINPQLASAWNNLGICLMETADYAEAGEAFQKSLTLNDGDHRTYSNLAVLYQKLGKWSECFSALNRALALKPDHVESLNNYGYALIEAGRPSEAVEVLDRVLRINPERWPALLNKATALHALGDTEAALGCLKAAIQLNPTNWKLSSNFLYLMGASGRHSAEDVAAAHVEVGRRLESTKVIPPRPLVPKRSGRKRLRVGFISPDLRAHSVAWFLLPLWTHHDRERMEFFVYADVECPDRVTDELKRGAASWRSVVGLGDEAVCDIIRRDEVDILIDLAGHTRENRLELFSRRPAPVAASWLGYPNTTGLTCVDYRITDAIADPPGRTEKLHSEKLIRLAGPAWCYQPSPAAMALQPVVRGESRPIVFCSFNNPVKYSELTIELWSRVLIAVPDSILLLKGRPLADSGVRSRFLARFEKFGIRPDRISMQGWSRSAQDHFSLYGDADIALDTFPYHGTTTTCEAMWMGVPTVTREGDAHISRVGVSLLAHVGLSELIAKTDDEYVAVASGLAFDHARRSKLRLGLRRRLQQSVLMDGMRFARSFAAACERMVASE